jgi:hypothetical protein
MLFYTIVPLEELLVDLDKERQFLTISREGILLQVEPIDGARGSVIRTLSGNPQDFLDPRWQPGAVVNLVAADYPTPAPK